MDHIISTSQFTRNYLEQLFEVIDSLQRKPAVSAEAVYRHLEGRVMASLFLEPSTRTRLSFESAMHLCGGSVVSVSHVDSCSIVKQETVEDTLRTVQEYVDLIVMRTPLKPSITESFPDFLTVPFINAGDLKEHPTQTLTDLYTIYKNGGIDGRKVFFYGDNKYARTVLSLKYALGLFEGVEIRQVDSVFYGKSRMEYRNDGQPTIEQRNKVLAHFTQGVKWADVIYLTRPQRERWSNNYYVFTNDHQNKDIPFTRLDKSTLSEIRKDAIIMHPLPKNDELSRDVYQDSRCKVWEQVRNGLSVRKALLEQLLL